MSETWRDRLLTLDRETTPVRAVELWGGNPASLRFASLRSNVVFRFEVGGAGRYLRLVHAGNRSLAEVSAVVAFPAHLHAAAAPVAGPVPSLAGRWAESLEQPDEVFVASVYREVSGTPLDRGCTDPTLFRAWGRALAALHEAAIGFRPADASAFRTILDQWELIRSRFATADASVRTAFDRVDAWLGTLSPGDDSPGALGDDWGLTHGDCNATNIVWDGSRAAIIDFDEPMFHWFAADVARPFREFPTGHPRRDACQGAMVEGYRSVRPLSAEWVSRIPWLVRMIDLDMLAWAWQLSPGSVLPGGETREAALAELRRKLATPIDEIG